MCVCVCVICVCVVCMCVRASAESSSIILEYVLKITHFPFIQFISDGDGVVNVCKRKVWLHQRENTTSKSEAE